jgi:hypothetical protein
MDKEDIFFLQENLSLLVAVPDINTIHLDTHWTEIENQPASSPSASLSPDDLAYVILILAYGTGHFIARHLPDCLLCRFASDNQVPDIEKFQIVPGPVEIHGCVVVLRKRL